MALRKGTLFLVGKLRDLMCSVTMLANVRMLFFSPPSLSTGGPNCAASWSLFSDLHFELVFCGSHELRVGVMKLAGESCFLVLFLDKSILEAVH
jgi:hypothetical protein